MKPGDFVKIGLTREEVEGTVLESHDSSIVLLKLKSGYNIGIPRENIHGEEIISHSETKEHYLGKYKIDQKKGLPKIGLIVTGGTIASKLDVSTGAVSALTDVGELARFYPGLFDIANVKVEVPFLKLSENLNAEDWIVLAKCITKMLGDKDLQGIVVTHGTDTLHYTSAALSFFLKNLGKPVVLTYAQRSIDRGSSDADLNLKCAARLALSEAAGVYVVGHANMDDDYCYAFLGTKVRKMHTSRRDAFKAINVEPVARVWPEKLEFLGMFDARNDESDFESDAVFSDKVALVKFYPGQSPDIIDYYRMHGFSGIVIEVLGIGNLPNEGPHSWIPAIKKAIREGMIVCGASQTVYGKLHPGVYSSGRELEKTGMVFLEDMLSETAYVKLGWVLAHRGWKGVAREKMLHDFAGELNGLLTE